jgi:CheY-like chemotaxis protein
MQRSRRRYPRAEAAFPVRVVEPSGKVWIGEGHDLSPFGAKIRDGHLRLHTLVRLEVDLPGGGPPLAIKALAVRSEPDGVAFAFVDLARAHYHLVRQAVDGLLLHTKLWIMIVEADRAAATVLADYVEREGHTALVLSTAEEALAYLDHDRVDAIMLDLGLPGTTGIALLEALAAREVRIPVVVVSGPTSEAEAARCLELGALDFVTKPFGDDQLKMVVSALSLKSLEERLSG